MNRPVSGAAATALAPAPARRGLRRLTAIRTFQPLEHDGFRILWLGLLTVYLAMQAAVVARGYLAFHLSGSAGVLGLVMLARGAPQFLLSPLGGVIADRTDKRRMLMGTQLAMSAMALATAALWFTGHIAVWHLIVISVVEGAVWVFNIPARQAFVPELVGEKDLMGAIALNSAGFNVARIMGPAVAGMLIAAPWFGIGGVFLLVAAGYGAFVLSLRRLPSGRPRAVRGHATGSVLTQLRGGFAYIGRDRGVRLLMLMGIVPIIFGMSYQNLLPVFQERVLNVGPRELGLLYSGAGIGALCGALAVASLVAMRRKDVVQICCGVTFGLALALFANMPAFLPAVLVIALVGGAGNMFTAMNNSMIMTATDRAYHGRVISIYEMIWSSMLFASWPIGVLVDRVTAPVTLTAFGLLVALAVLALSPARLRVRSRAAGAP